MIDQARGPEFDRLYKAMFTATKSPANITLTAMTLRLFDEGVRVTPLLPETVKPTLPGLPGYRFQLSRKRGARMPEGGVSCARPHRYSNPFIIGTPENGGNITRDMAVSMFREALIEGRMQFTVAEVRAKLRGLPLGCFCSMDQACHVDVLVAIANGDPS